LISKRRRHTFGDTSDEKFQFPFIEHIDQLLRDELVEPFHESGMLLLHALGDAIFDHIAGISDELLAPKNIPKHLLDKLRLVILGHGYISTSGPKLNRHKLSKALLLNAECLLNDICNVVLPVKSILAVSVKLTISTHRVHDILRCSSASTLSRSDKVIFLWRIILYMLVMK
jgi:hypothetical protein